MVDAFHFFMNMLLCGTGAAPENIAKMFTDAYLEKNAINARRQQEGYTGLDKCRSCGRDLQPGSYVELDAMKFCNNTCYERWETEDRG
jgi:hypothetical protein